ncbi:MAG: DUF4864 domain-containing protein [Burkholderiaceae bacterium]
MRKFVVTLAAGLVLAAAGLMPAAQAAPLPASDALAVQRVVQAQLDAFAKDDAKRAFALAAPSIKRSFGSAGKFLRMVRSSYPVVYRHTTVTFLKPLIEGRDVVLPVRMTDEEGDSWLAVYRLQRQKDRAWRIAGCVVGTERGQTV